MSEPGDKSLRGSRSQQSDSPDDIETDRMVEVGSFGAPHGVRGEMRLFEADLDSPVFAQGSTIWVNLRRGWRSLTVTELRATPKHGIIAFADIEDRNEAAQLRNETVFVPVESLPEPEDGAFYQAELQGRSVFMRLEPADEASTEALSFEPDTFRRIGEVGGFFETNGANDVMVVILQDGEELFVPMIEAAVAPIQENTDRVLVHHPSRWGPEGLDIPPEVPKPTADTDRDD